MSQARCRPHSSIEAGEREDRRDEVAGVPDAAARGHPQDLRREAEQDRQPQPIEEARDARGGPSSHQHMPTPPAASAALIPDSSWSAARGPMSATIGMSATAGNGANGT